MHLLDWLAMGIPLAAVTFIALYTRRYMKSVADFMAGGRNAGRYLICTARSEMGSGAVVFVAMFEIFSRAGFTLTWWGTITIPVGLLVAITGFVIYRYRQTRAMTLAQFFEMRYSRRFRLFAGALAFVAGICNFGIIPIIGARFFVHFLGLPPALHLATLAIPTDMALMALFLSISLLTTMVGGQISILVGDCAEGILSQIFYVVIAVTLLLMFSWSQMSHALLNRPPGQSMVNPFDSFQISDFNLWYVLMSVFVGIYGTMAWQNSHAFNSSGASPHESRMGGILGRWREFARNVMVTLLALAAITYLRHPDFAAGAAQVGDALSHISDPRTRGQMEVPLALAYLLPIGIKGLLCAVILMGVFSGDGMHLHSWGSILIQDVILPLRRRPMTPRQHIRLLRWSMVGVALWAFVFGSLFRQTEYVVMWFQVTTAIFVGGAGAAIIGGLYWKRGTTAGAWAGVLAGSILSTGGILLRQWYHDFPLNGTEISFYGALIAIAVYVLVSLATCRKPFNMDWLLHRGAYAVEPQEPAVVAAETLPPARRFAWSKVLMGIDEDFSRADRWITAGIFWWSMFWFAVFLLGTGLWFIHPWSDQTWMTYWGVTAIWLPLVIGVITTIWFTWGATRDLRVFFRRLREESVDTHDDGTVERPQPPAPAPNRASSPAPAAGAACVTRSS